MSSTIFPIKKDARADRIYFRFNPIVDLTGRTLLFTMTERQFGTVKIDRAAAVIAVGAHTIDGILYPALTALDSWGYYDWTGVTDLDTPGTYNGEAWIVYPGPKYSKWPSSGFATIIISEDAP
jgi:hypothetical protein